MRSADVAWLVLVAGIVVYEAWSPDGELLSEAFDRYVDRFPVLSRLVPIVVTLHVTNLVPARFDVIHGAFCVAEWLKGR